MSSLTVRNLDESVKNRLRVRAARHGRSMEEEVRQILQNIVAPEQQAGHSSPGDSLPTGQDGHRSTYLLAESFLLPRTRKAPCNQAYEAESTGIKRRWPCLGANVSTPPLMRPLDHPASYTQRIARSGADRGDPQHQGFRDDR
jgi:hypothetical protein